MMRMNQMRMQLHNSNRNNNNKSNRNNCRDRANKSQSLLKAYWMIKNNELSNSNASNKRTMCSITIINITNDKS